jgi:hypothetical protein
MPRPRGAGETLALVGDSNPVLSAEREPAHKCAHDGRGEVSNLQAQRIRLARQYGGGERKRLQALLGAMRLGARAKCHPVHRDLSGSSHPGGDAP